MGPQLAEFFGVKQGVLVRSVAEGSAAEKAGIKAGDVIVKIGNGDVDRVGTISKLMREAVAPTAGAEATATAMFGMSPYSSPELVRKAKNIDVRTDVWSLGVVLYRALAGIGQAGRNRLPHVAAGAPVRFRTGPFHKRTVGGAPAPLCLLNL